MAGRFRLPPEVGVPFVDRLDAGDRPRAPRGAQGGDTEAREAHAADAFAGDDEGSAGRDVPGRADVVLRLRSCDAAGVVTPTATSCVT